MKLQIQTSDGAFLNLESHEIIQFNLIPETKDEKENGTFWGTRMSVGGFIKDLERAAKKNDPVT